MIDVSLSEACTGLSISDCIPRYITEGSAAFDFFCVYDTLIPKGSRGLISTGVRFAIPRGHCVLICSRSGLALNHGVFVLNAPGVIDSDYRGEIKVILANLGSTDYRVRAGDRIAQGLYTTAERTGFFVSDSLFNTTRGDGGFGSTGT